MKSFTIGAVAVAAVLALTTSFALAVPTKVEGPQDKQITVLELVSRLGKWDKTDVADFASADKIIVYHIPDTYKFTDLEKACDAQDTAGMLGKMHEAFSADAEVAKWFKDNGYNVDDLLAVVHNSAQKSFEIYLR